MKELGIDSEATYKEVRNGFPSLPLNQVICGDAFEVLKDFPENSIDCVVTDPPFKVSQMYGGGTDADNLINVSSILKVIPQISRILKEGKFAVFFYDNRILPFLFEAVKNTELTYRKSIYLYRKWGIAHRWMGWMQCTDPICFFVKGQTEQFHAKVKGKVHHDCYVKKRPEAVTSGHPAQKPLNLIKDVIFWCSNENDVVLDPYCGSGVTLIGAHQLKRKWIGIDIERKYVKMSEENIRKYTFFKPLAEFLGVVE